MQLISYVRTATRQAVTHIQESRWFKSMYTLEGKPDTYDTYASHASPRTLPVGGPQAYEVYALQCCIFCTLLWYASEDTVV
jgi:hypothetical protein